MPPEEWLKTTAILVICLTYVSKLAVDGWRRRRNGDDYPYSDRRISVDVHKWLSPMTDSKTGQPVFAWKTRGEMMRVLDKLEDVTHELHELVLQLKDRNTE